MARMPNQIQKTQPWMPSGTWPSPDEPSPGGPGRGSSQGDGYRGPETPDRKSPLPTLTEKEKKDGYIIKDGFVGKWVYDKYLPKGKRRNFVPKKSWDKSNIGKAADIVDAAYNKAERGIPDTSAYDQYGGTVNTASEYDGPVETAEEYTGPVGDRFVERFNPTNWWEGGGDNPYRDLIMDELGREAYDTEGRRANEARRAGADARQNFAIAQRARDRELMSMGINPESGAYGAAGDRAALGESLLATGAANEAREGVRTAGIADRDRRLQIGAMGQDAAESDRQFELASYQATQAQRQFGAQLGFSAWESYQNQKAGDANRAVGIWGEESRQREADANRELSVWEIAMGVKAEDMDREQRERLAYLESLGAIFGDLGGVSNNSPIPKARPASNRPMPTKGYIGKSRAGRSTVSSAGGSTLWLG